MKNKVVQLKNMYTGDIVITEKYDDVKKTSSEVNFIEVYSPQNPYRKFLVNRDAYVKVNTK
jgi:hypothetical protein